MNSSELSIGKHILSAGKKFSKGLLGKNSISDIDKVVSCVDSNGNNRDKAPRLDGEHSRIYMGKMNEEEMGIYSDDFLKGILQYYFLHTPSREQISLELANGVSEVLGENMQGFMTFEEQKKYIYQFIRKNFGKNKEKQVKITNIEDDHKELFQELKKYEMTIKSEAAKKGIGLGELEQTPSFDKLTFLDVPVHLNEEENFTSLDIARYLSIACKQNKTLWEKIKAIKPEKAKSDFYPLIEISIRLTDLLKGIVIQGGALKQKQYDNIIREILNPYVNIAQYPELQPLRDFCLRKLGDQKFETLYMDGNAKKYRTLTEKLAQEKINSSKIRTYTAIALLGALSLGAVKGGISYHQREKTKAQLQETIKDIFENKTVPVSGDVLIEYEGKEKEDQINNYILGVYNRFLVRYGNTGGFSELEFKAKIAGCLTNQKALDMLGEGYYDGGIPKEDKIIDEYLLPTNKGEFIIDGVPVVPYERYLEYTDAFINTLFIEEDFETNWDEGHTELGPRYVSQYKNIKDIGAYSPKYQGIMASSGRTYELGLLKRGGKSFIVATQSIGRGEFNSKEAYKLTSSRGKELAIDFLKETQPSIIQLLDQYMIRYYKFYKDSYTFNSETGSLQITGERETLRRDIEELLIKDFLRKGLFKKIDKVQVADRKAQIPTINNYLDDFVIENYDTLKNSGFCNALPNDGFQKYEEAMKNTMDDIGKLNEPKARLNQEIMSFSLEEQKNNSGILQYISSTGEKYFVGSVDIDGKKYFCARKVHQSGPLRYGKTYSTNAGYDVAKDYFKTKAQFLQKKILYEKKLKSASQMYRPLPGGKDTNDYIPNTRNSRPR